MTVSVSDHPVTQRRQAVGLSIYRLGSLAQIAPHTLGRVERGLRPLHPAESARIDAVLSAHERATQQASRTVKNLVGRGMRGCA
jgi:hypothetical protein